MKKRRISLIILLLLLSAVCLASLTMAWKEYADQASDRHAFDELAELVEKPEETTVPATETESTDTTEDTTEETTDAETEPEPTEQKRNLAPIMEQNSECIGWIYIEGTAVNYPVMHTPSDPQKYLRKNFEKKYSVSGIPFLDYRCTPATNLIIYGHNMKNGTMFSDLKKYLDKSFREQHPVIELETADGVRYFTVMDYYLLFSARYDFRDSIVNTYPPQAVRTIENNGQKSMYIVYETDDETRVFVFFFESDGFQFTRGYPIVMKKSLEMSDFSTLENGDSMDDVEKIDPIAALYRKGYDTLSDELIHSLYVNGKETISSVHLLTDGIIRINYTRNSEGSYIIEQIIKSENFTIPVIGGRLCYLIYPEDYI